MALNNLSGDKTGQIFNWTLYLLMDKILCLVANFS